MQFFVINTVYKSHGRAIGFQSTVKFSLHSPLITPQLFPSAKALNTLYAYFINDHVIAIFILKFSFQYRTYVTVHVALTTIVMHRND